MSRIRLLPEALANKIAAGEVVERPASVVKELMENSLDAGARNLEVTVQAGGKRLIRVLDDGEGMTPDDALLAFERHATSKIRQAEDLSRIHTLGFRGEALPSIAGVSRLLMETRAKAERVGTAVEIAGSRMVRVREIARAVGTTLTVRDLFFNLPARKKFLRADRTELGHVVNVVTQYALAHPEGRFALAGSGSRMFDFQAVDPLRDRLFQVFGADLLGQLVELEEELSLPSHSGSPRDPRSGEKVRIHAFVSKPEVQKPNRQSLYFFVNRRMVRDRILMHALGEAYRRILPDGSFPVALVFIEMPFAEVDVNVHPSKTEVRFRRQSMIHDCLRDAVRKALMEARPQAAFSIQPEGMEVEPPFAPGTPGPHPPSWLSRSERTPFAGTAPLPLTVGEPVPTRLESRSGLQTPSGPAATDALPTPAPGRDPSPPICAAAALVSREQAEAIQAASSITISPDHIHPLGQIEDSFIVAGDRGSLLIIDQHVAHERVLFEKVLRQRGQGRVESQRLLLPLIVELNPRQQILLDDLTPELNSCGFEVEPFGRRTLAVKALPADLGASDCSRLLGELLEGLEKEAREVSLERLQEKIAASVACHAAIKVNTHLDRSKMVWLIDELLKTRYPMTCPHGRPVILRYEKKEILKAFKRI
ncbi:MAG: DNA mismatch repair endonuclease MutL [Acidobacteriota bacterium]|nr:DNA mismatch repair endonuclease MutL [Acidobacteriota bacterium]MDE2963461.1 DNA mismatch repair endonuclease MutL [Acidobacteriota bacterium]